MENIELLIALIPAAITAIPGTIASIIAIRTSIANRKLEQEKLELQKKMAETARKKDIGEYGDKIAQGYSTFVDDLRKEQQEMRERLDALEQQKEKDKVEIASLTIRVKHLEGGVRALVKQLKNIDPSIVPAYVLEEQ